MDKKTTAIVCHITFIGWIIAMCAGNKEEAKFWLNQTLVLWLFGLLTIIPCAGQIWAIFIFVCWILSLISACNEEEKPIPLLGGIKILK